MRLLIAAALVAAFSVPAYAQLTQDKRPTTFRSEEAKQNDAAIDQEYRRRHEYGKADQANNAKADPWSGVRSSTPAAPAAPAKKSGK